MARARQAAVRASLRAVFRPRRRVPGGRTDRDFAPEAVARTFEVAWRRLAEVPVELASVAARRRPSRTCRATSRARPSDALIERIAATAVAASDDQTEAEATRELVLAAIGELSPAQQEAVLLVAWDGLSERDAAAVLGCSRAAVAVRLHRARKPSSRVESTPRPPSNVPGMLSAPRHADLPA